MLHLVKHLSPYMLALLFVVIFCAAAEVCLWITGKVLPWIRFEQATDLGEIFSDAIGGMFALLFALVTVAVWQNHDRLDTVVSDEANVLHNIYRNLEQYPPDLRDKGRAMLKTYVDQVVKVEWEAASHGQQDEGAHRTITDLNKLLFSYRPPTLGELPLHSQTLVLVTTCRGLRHDRLRGGQPYLDTTMWTALVLAGFIYLFYSCCYKAENRKAYRVMVISLGAALGLVFYMLVVYNYAFAGPGAISSEPFSELSTKFWVID